MSDHYKANVVELPDQTSLSRFMTADSKTCAWLPPVRQIPKVTAIGLIRKVWIPAEINLLDQLTTRLMDLGSETVFWQPATFPKLSPDAAMQLRVERANDLEQANEIAGLILQRLELKIGGFDLPLVDPVDQIGHKGSRRRSIKEARKEIGKYLPSIRHLVKAKMAS